MNAGRGLQKGLDQLRILLTELIIRLSKRRWVFRQDEKFSPVIRARYRNFRSEKILIHSLKACVIAVQTFNQATAIYWRAGSSNTAIFGSKEELPDDFTRENLSNARSLVE